MHDYWWNDRGWARCKCGEYLCVVGRKLEPTARAVADSALDTHRMTESGEPHSCESCPTCGMHDGRHNKCCGCYDGACCQEWGDL